MRILLVNCIDPCRNEGLEAAGESAPDFYAEITFAGFPTHTTPRAPDDQEQVTPFWEVTRDIPTTVVEQDIAILIKDHDSTSADDLADSSPRVGDPYTRVKVNMINGKVTGDLTSSAGCVAGNGEPGGGIFGADPQPAVQVCFEITPSSAADSDGDGFTDYEEYRGRDFDGDNVVDLVLPNADPTRRDIYVEIDYMRGLRPQTGVLSTVEGVFNNALVTNQQTGASGLALHLLEDEEVPFATTTSFNNVPPDAPADDFDNIKLGSPEKACGTTGTGRFGTAADRASPLCADILNFKRQRFRYGLFVNGLTGAGTTSGRAELHDRGGNDFVVSLGRWTTNMFTNVGGRKAAEEATLLHELGHTFGLGHGGRRDNGTVDLVNCKPNYQSVMSYSWQFTDLDANRPLDYQRFGKATLVENNLDETANPGLPGVVRPVIYGVGGVVTYGSASGPIDWTGDGPPFSASAQANINHLPTVGNDCISTSNTETLLSSPDWDRLQYNFTNSPHWSDGNRGDMPAELTGEEVLTATSADLTAALTVDKTDANGGDTVTATVTIGNKGGSGSTATSVTFTPPAGNPVTRTIPDLAPGGSRTETFTYTVPCTVTDGGTLTATATVTGKNAQGTPEPAELLADNTASATTRAHVPVLTLTPSATATVNAGEAITYTVSHRNTGSAAATGATLTYTLPANVYYSTGLDTGAGPRPATVTRNADGTTTLTWNLGTVAANGTGTVAFTARPSLLLVAGTPVTGTARVSYGGANGCAYDPVTGSATTTVTVVPPSRQPLVSALWMVRTDLRTPEALARVQATDQRFDGADGSAANGVLSQPEASAALFPPSAQPRRLQQELLATLLNLATRRINAGTEVRTVTIQRLDLDTVADAVRYAQATLTQPPTLANLIRYNDASLVLTEINTGVAERY
ncbi:CARDB domain-containing protein [Acrocarpospora catenulata]|uniref:CARDB domain-containing protein n=1 Tax=Acrocarpospora catenulata TaxID=2836182 RepID=UPI001BDA6F2A|nr:CARDB domain-containing protein [Acrocarpospora catenulata]